MNQEFELRYVAPGILRLDNHQFLLIYKDAQGKLEFSGLQYHPNCMLYVPSAREWDSLLPFRKGQREVVVDRLLTFLRDDPGFESYLKSIRDPNYFASFPGEGAKLRRSFMSSFAPARKGPVDQRNARPRWTMSAVLAFTAVIVLTTALPARRAWKQWNRPSPSLTPAALLRFEGVEAPSNTLIYPPTDKTTINVRLAGLAAYGGLRCEEHDDGGRPTEKLAVNDLALSGFGRVPREFPVDSIIFKILEASPSRRLRILAMRKREAGFDPKNGNWSYLTGESLGSYESGRIGRCIACHSKAAADGYVFNRSKDLKD